jgi:hypothetical protein
MSTFTIHTIDTAKSKPLLENTQKTVGFIPNMHAIMAEAPSLLEGYS